MLVFQLDCAVAYARFYLTTLWVRHTADREQLEYSLPHGNPLPVQVSDVNLRVRCVMEAGGQMRDENNIGS